jgi:hypothetical protein
LLLKRFDLSLPARPGAGVAVSFGYYSGGHVAGLVVGIDQRFYLWRFAQEVLQNG